MIKLALMIEGQDGLDWAAWKRLVRSSERLGFSGIFRSDHFTNSAPPDKDSLELWTSLTWLADNTESLEFGPLVAPVSFRHPVFIARIGRELDDLSGGRLTLGMGAGWQAREHNMFGFDLLDVNQRMQRFEEGVEVVARLLREERRVTFSGDFYQLRDAVLLPRPERETGPDLLLGGNGRKRTIPLAARWADEWNGVGVTPHEYRELNDILDRACLQAGRRPGDVRRSVMVNLVFRKDADQHEDELSQEGLTFDDLRSQGRIAGRPAEIVDQIRQYEQAGASRMMLQWLDHSNLDGLEAFAAQVLHAFA